MDRARASRGESRRHGGPPLPYERSRPADSRGLLRVVLAPRPPRRWPSRSSTSLSGSTTPGSRNNLPPEETARDIAPRPRRPAVGTISYLIWFIGLIVSAVGTGSTALISRARSAPAHRRLANSVCGQSISAAFVLGLLLAIVLYAGAPMWIRATRPERRRGRLRVLLPADARVVPAVPDRDARRQRLPPWRGRHAHARRLHDPREPREHGVQLRPDLRLVGACPRHGGFDGHRGWARTIAYVLGGLLQFWRACERIPVASVSTGTASRPHWHTLRRIFRVGVPAGRRGAAHLGRAVHDRDRDQPDGPKPTSPPPAHLNAVKIEGVSATSPGFAFATAAATLVGQSLGMKEPRRAKRGTYLAYALGGGIMTLCGIVFILWGRTLALWMLPRQPEIADLTAKCLLVTGFIQSGFAASMIFSGALRGRGRQPSS